MGLFEKIFRRPSKASSSGEYFTTLTAYSPAFTTRAGSMYEYDLVRAAVDARARHISKLEVRATGAAKPKLQSRIPRRPNDFQTWSQFLYRTSTILDMQNTAFIVPVTDVYGEQIGYYPVLPSRCELVNVNGELWIRYRFNSGKTAALPAAECGVMTKFQYGDDFFGETNSAINPTLKMLDMQNTSIEEAVKQSATYRFMAKVSNFAREEDLAKERKRFDREHLQGDGGGILLFPNTYTDIKQIEPKPYTVDAKEMEQIKENVFNYFGVNIEVLQNKALGNTLDAFFNGAIEPFEIQLSEVLTGMTFSDREIAAGSRIEVTSNRLQYMPVDTKINMVNQLGDRGMITLDEARALFNLPPLPDGAGAAAPIRGEYYNATTGVMDKTDADHHQVGGEGNATE